MTLLVSETSHEDLVKLIAARRQLIRDEASCDGCGATLVSCEANRGKDPAAPPWFGCCAQGYFSEPCRHSQDREALTVLLSEIQAGQVRTVEEVRPPIPEGPRRASMHWLLHQGDLWQPQHGPAVRIADMHICHRYHTVRWLEDRAPSLAFREVTWMATKASGPLGPSGDMACDAFDREMDEVQKNPLAWLRSTALHQSLSRALPHRPKKLRLLAARAAHWSTCPCRDDLAAICACPPKPKVIAGTGSDAEGTDGL